MPNTGYIITRPPKPPKPLSKSAQLRGKVTEASTEVLKKAYNSIRDSAEKPDVKGAFKRTRKENAEEELLAPIHPNPQLGCILFKFPQEIRDQIYAEVFAATRVWFEYIYRDIFGKAPVKKKRKHHALALLSCCSRIRNEIGHSWLNHILLCCQSPQIMLEKLLNVPAPLSCVGYVRVHGLMGMMLAVRSTRSPSADAMVHEFLRSLPGLALEELEVVADGSGSGTWEYQAVELLLDRSFGWKKLTVYFPGSGLLGRAPSWSGREDEHFEYRHGLQGHVRRPLPWAFREVLLERDGADSGSTVDIFQGPQHDEEVTKLDILRRRILGLQHQDKEEAQFPELYYWKRDKNFDPRYQLWVVAQRGRGVNCTVPPLRMFAKHHWPYWRTREYLARRVHEANRDPDT
ncbi:hypothetical protein PG997_001536 [Apiospora hydei]|uniref:Uncharacterized protein n=1 Tax=Apiospora hydei TaxID=1337664 RepID=A0ABR1XDT6_9PEZI